MHDLDIPFWPKAIGGFVERHRCARLIDRACYQRLGPLESALAIVCTTQISHSLYMRYKLCLSGHCKLGDGNPLAP